MVGVTLWFLLFSLQTNVNQAALTVIINQTLTTAIAGVVELIAAPLSNTLLFQANSATNKA